MAAMPRMLPSHATVDRRGFVIAIAIIGVIFGGLYSHCRRRPELPDQRQCQCKR